MRAELTNYCDLRAKKALEVQRRLVEKTCSYRRTYRRLHGVLPGGWTVFVWNGEALIQVI